MKPRHTDPEALLDHLDWVRSLARRLVQDGHDREDATQETWLKALRGDPATPRRPRSWLGKVLSNTVMEQRRADARREAREQEVARPLSTSPTDQVVARVEQERLLVQEVLGLPDHYRDVILLRYFENQPPRQIARSLDLPVNTVRTRLQRALQRLRERIDDSAGGPLQGGILLATVAGGAAATTGKVIACAVVVVMLSAGAALWSLEPWSVSAGPDAGPVQEPAAAAVVTPPTVVPQRREEGTSGSPTVATRRVQVVDATSGEPIPEARMRALASDASASCEVSVDERGWAEVPGRAPHWVLVDAEGFLGRLVLLPEDQSVVSVESPAHLTVQVLAADGTPLSGLDVTLYVPERRDRDADLRSQRSQKNLTRLQPSTLENDTLRRVLEGTRECREDEATAFAELWTQAGSEPIAWLGRRPVTTALTGADGRAEFQVPGGGPYQLELDESCFLDQDYESNRVRRGFLSGNRCENFTLVAGESREVVLTLAATAEVIGRLAVPAALHATASVRLSQWIRVGRGREMLRAVDLEPDGTFRIRGVPPGDHHLTATWTRGIADEEHIDCVSCPVRVATPRLIDLGTLAVEDTPPLRVRARIRDSLGNDRTAQALGPVAPLANLQGGVGREGRVGISIWAHRLVVRGHRFPGVLWVDPSCAQVLNGLPEGPCSVSWSGPSVTPAQQPLETDESFEIQLPMTETVWLDATVRDVVPVTVVVQRPPGAVAADLLLGAIGGDRTKFERHELTGDSTRVMLPRGAVDLMVWEDRPGPDSLAWSGKLQNEVAGDLVVTLEPAAILEATIEGPYHPGRESLELFPSDRSGGRVGNPSHWPRAGWSLRRERDGVYRCFGLPPHTGFFAPGVEKRDQPIAGESADHLRGVSIPPGTPGGRITLDLVWR